MVRRAAQCVLSDGLCAYSMYLHTFRDSVMIPRDLVRMKSPAHNDYSSNPDSSYFAQIQRFVL